MNTTNKSVVKCDQVTGTKVKNQQKKDLGKVEAVMINKIEGRVAYVVLSFGGFLGMGDKLFAMPWEIFTYDQNEDCFIINIDQKKLENSSGFDKNNWPDMSDLKWSESIHHYYGTGHSGYSSKHTPQ